MHLTVLQDMSKKTGLVTNRASTFSDLSCSFTKFDRGDRKNRRRSLGVKWCARKLNKKKNVLRLSGW